MGGPATDPKTPERISGTNHEHAVHDCSTGVVNDDESVDTGVPILEASMADDRTVR